MTTLHYTKNEHDKTIIELDPSLKDLGDSYNAFLDKLKNGKEFNVIMDEMSDEDLMLFLFKNYVWIINKISKTQESNRYFDYTDKIIYYYVKSILTNEEIKSFSKFDGTLDDIDQFIQVLDMNKNNTVLKQLAYMHFDMMVQEQTIDNTKGK